MELAGKLAAALDRPLGGPLGPGAAVGAAVGPALGMGPAPAGGVPAAMAASASASAWGPQARRRREAASAAVGPSVGLGPGPTGGVPAAVAAGAWGMGPPGRRRGEPRSESGPRVGAWGSGRSGASILGAYIPSQPLPSQALASQPLPSQLPSSQFLPSQPLPSSQFLPSTSQPLPPSHPLSNLPSPTLAHSPPSAHHSHAPRTETCAASAHTHHSAPAQPRAKAAAWLSPGALSFSPSPPTLPARGPSLERGPAAGASARAGTGTALAREAGPGPATGPRAKVVAGAGAWGKPAPGAGAGVATASAVAARAAVETAAGAASRTAVGAVAGLRVGLGAGAGAGTGVGTRPATGAWGALLPGTGSQARAHTNTAHIPGAAAQGTGSGGGGGAYEGVPEADPKAARKGSLVEFEKERGKTGLGVVVGTQGKKNWLVMDQFGIKFSVRPQQVTFSVLPPAEAGQGPRASEDSELSFQPADLVAFVADAKRLMDPSLLHMAWEELAASRTESVSLGALALILFNEAGPRELYACHSMLASDAVFFRQKKGPQTCYVPRTEDQVAQLQAKAQAEAEARQRLQEFGQMCRGAMRAEWGAKPSPGEWQRDPFAAPRLRALLAFALEKAEGEQISLANEALQATGTPSTPAAALELLLSLGALPRHVNISLLQANIPAGFPAMIDQMARQLAASPPPDPDRELRRDLTHLKVYMIDSADTVEVDDGLSAETLPDGRVKVWVHVADPTRWVALGSTMDMTARMRGTSLYLPEMIIPMLPFPLAAGPMSLHYGSECTRRTEGTSAEHSGTVPLGESDSDSSTSSIGSGRSSSSSESSDSCSSDGSRSFGGSLAAWGQGGGDGHAWALPSESLAEEGGSRQESGSSSGSSGAGDSQGEAPGVGRQCAMSVGVILRENGSVAEYEIVPSYIHPTYRLTFEELPEMLAVAAPEESEMGLLVREAQKRSTWREEQGARNMYMVEGSPKVKHPESPDPPICLDLIDQGDAARQLVAEMMVLCGEVVADFGAAHGVPLPYRGQQAAEVSPEAAEVLEGLQGPSLAAHLRLTMNRSSTNCSAPVPHAALGLPGYVQFSSPIRRYGDLLAHYQVKAVLRGEAPPLSGSQLQRLMMGVGEAQRAARKVEGAALKYWVLEYLRRLPLGTPLRAVMLRWVKQDDDRVALVHLTDIGYETTMRMTRKVRLGAEILVVVSEVNPRRAFLRLDEALWAEDESFDEASHHVPQSSEGQSAPAQSAAAGGSRETSS